MEAGPGRSRTEPTTPPGGGVPAGSGTTSAAFTHATELRSEEHTSELQSQSNLVCRLLLEKKNVTCPETEQDVILSCLAFANMCAVRSIREVERIFLGSSLTEVLPFPVLDATECDAYVRDH